VRSDGVMNLEHRHKIRLTAATYISDMLPSAF